MVYYSTIGQLSYMDKISVLQHWLLVQIGHKLFQPTYWFQEYFKAKWHNTFIFTLNAWPWEEIKQTQNHPIPAGILP